MWWLVYICVLILLYMCPRTTKWLSAYYYICVLMLLGYSPADGCDGVLFRHLFIPKYVSWSCCVSSFFNTCVLKNKMLVGYSPADGCDGVLFWHFFNNNYTCPHTTIYVALYMCPHGTRVFSCRWMWWRFISTFLPTTLATSSGLKSQVCFLTSTKTYLSAVAQQVWVQYKF